MAKTAFEKIAAGLEDAIAYAEGDLHAGRAHAIDVRAIRAKTRLSQDGFAGMLRIKPATLRNWEQRRRSPDASAQTLLRMVDADPQAALALLQKI